MTARRERRLPYNSHYACVAVRAPWRLDFVFPGRLCPEAAVHCRDDAADRAHQRAGAVPRRPTWWRSPCRLRISTKNTKPKQIYVVPVERRNAAADHARRQRERASALVARFAADLFHLQSRRIVADLGDGRRRRPCAPDHASLDRGRRHCSFRPTARRWCFNPASIRSAARTTPATSASSTKKRKSKVKARIYTSLLYRHWNAVAERAAAASVGDRRRWHGREGSDAGPARCASVFAGRSGRLRDFAGFAGGGVRHERRSGAGHQHQLRYLHGSASTAAIRARSPSGWAPTTRRCIRRTGSISRSVRRRARVMRATAGG